VDNKEVRTAALWHSRDVAASARKLFHRLLSKTDPNAGPGCGSPWENGYVESFNGRLRDELLNGEIFTTLREAQSLMRAR
jgi:transposase InsO family protein